MIWMLQYVIVDKHSRRLFVSQSLSLETEETGMEVLVVFNADISAYLIEFTFESYWVKLLFLIMFPLFCQAKDL